MFLFLEVKARQLCGWVFFFFEIVIVEQQQAC